MNITNANVIDGQSESFTAIFNTYWKKLYVIAYRRLGDEELAKDIVQDVFVYFWKERANININESLEAYLRRSVQYQIIAHFRKHTIHSKALSFLLEKMNEVEVNIRDILTEQDFANTVNSEVKEMPGTMQEIFKLRFKDRSIKEISEQLGLAEKTVRNNISIGLVRIRKAISRDFPEDFSAICLALYILLGAK
ncbi:ECF RNA polymerase sigma factor SigW [compost metagenome]|uniref:RNA polymerase sigma factor n=1 Tax=Pedobacter sp. ok626 TaxID=1761882 RepID=UPI00087E29B7|nr:sigma-70 family RNA polymerase sigma factor [Pedobacter sp. ok626]SDL97814.1 RNA polymerase sigma-70 factor, ECF subfamily [Pedobacter sp. ok626]